MPEQLRFGAVTCNVIGLCCNFFYQLCTHVLECIFQLDLFCDGHTIVGDQRSTVGFIQCYVTSLGSKGYSDGVVLKQLVAEETTKSGIVLPGQNKEKPQQAEVIAVGPGGVVDGKEVKMEVKVGDQVIYSKYAGTDVKLDDEEYIVVKQSDILAVKAKPKKKLRLRANKLEADYYGKRD